MLSVITIGWSLYINFRTNNNNNNNNILNILYQSIFACCTPTYIKINVIRSITKPHKLAIIIKPTQSGIPKYSVKNGILLIKLFPNAIKIPFDTPIGPIGLDHIGIELWVLYPFVDQTTISCADNWPSYFHILLSLYKNTVGIAVTSNLATTAGFLSISIAPTLKYGKSLATFSYT